MKFKTLFITCVGATLLASSCIKEEGLDREADILSVSIENEGFLTALINEDKDKGLISLVMEGDISMYESGIIVPKITTSPYATLSPSSQEAVALEKYKKNYVVKAEDGSQKKYELTVTPFQPLVQDFEDWYTGYSGSYTFDIPTNSMWRTANRGVAMLYRQGEPFPTRKTEESRPESEGKYSVHLQTVEGGKMGDIHIPLYAGNMYTGTFDLNSGISEPLKTTKFGQPHPKYLGKPLALTAWYKYKPGEKYQTWNKNTKEVGWESSNKIDKADIYAILFKVTKGEVGRNEFLNAENIKTSEKIVATAIMDDQTEKTDWTKLVIKFKHIENLDFVNNDYKLAVVLSSSERGAHFEGAVGSTLIVDDLRVVFERDEDANLYQK